MSVQGGGFIEALLARVAAQPDAIAVEIEGEGRRLTYAELLAACERMRGSLVALGVGRGDAVLMALPSGPELVAAFYALASLGARAVPVSEHMTAFELAPIFNDARPIGAIVADPLTARSLGSCPSARFVLWAGPGGRPDGADARVTPLGDASSPLTAPSGDPIVSCHFTYKGLGYPLGVLHAYSSYGACLRGCAERYAASAGGTHLVGLPMHPVYSLIGAVLMPLTLGAKLLVVRNIGARDVSELLAEHDVRFACLVPLLLRGMIARGGGTRPNLRSDLEVITGGSHLSPELATAVAERLGVEPLQGYGLTETLPVTSSVRGDNRAGSLGKPVREDVKVTIVDSRGREVPRGRVGEIAVAGPSLMRGFANRPRETARFLRDGRFHTGDVGHMDRDGFLHFDGRALPFTKCAAQMVDLREIEMVLLRHPKVADARATVSDERVSVSVILNKHAVMTPADVIAHAAQHLSKHKLPRRVKLYERAIQKLAVNQ